MRAIVLALTLLLAACAGWGVTRPAPPCNAWIVLWGNADLHLDCPAFPRPPPPERTR